MKISVCIATYNGAKYIEEQLSSILNQLSENDEVIISDDNSGDRTLDIINSFGDKRIVILKRNPSIKSNKRYENHVKVSSNFQNSLEHVSGDLIFLSDQDDIWYENKVKICYDALSTCDLVASDYSIINDNGVLLKEKRHEGISPLKSNLFANIVYLPFKGCCLAFRKEMLTSILPFPKNTVVHDDWIGCVIFLKGQCLFIDKPLIFHRVHDNNVSVNMGRHSLSYKFVYRFFLFVDVVKRVYLGLRN